MREVLLSNCERDFILDSLASKQRVDGRESYDYRKFKVIFGVDRGCCCVELGKTRVMTQVSCEVTSPKQARPSEGIVYLNVELSPMAAAHFESGRPSEQGTEISRILERCIKESRCVDTESLCIMAGVKVWTIRVDIHVLNHDGNLIDCCSVSSIAALAHFRRPDVTVSGEEVTIHSVEDRDPVPLSVHHMPICVTFAFYNQGKHVLVDPCEREERVMDGKMVIGMNKHREICTLQMTGSMLLLKEQMQRCSHIAVVKVAEITELVQLALENDSKARAAGEKYGFAASVVLRQVTSHQVDAKPIGNEPTALSDSAENESEQDESLENSMEVNFQSKIVSEKPNTMTIADGGADTWKSVGGGEVNTWIDDEDRSEEMKKEQQLMWQTLRYVGTDKPLDDVSDGDSEEEETTMLAPEDIQEKKTKSSKIDLTGALKSKAVPGRRQKGTTLKQTS